MQNLLLLATAVQALGKIQSSGCNSSLPDGITLGESKALSIPSTSGVTPRQYRIHVPKSYDIQTPVPLILSFHGRTKDAINQERLSQFSNASYGFAGISVYPEGVPDATSGSQQWQGDPSAPTNISDITFTLELISHIQDTFCIDPSRIYAAGKSNGGGFTGLLACNSTSASKIAAFAPVSGAWYLNNTTQQLPPCDPGRDRVPWMEFHGFKDHTIEYKGGLNDRKNGNTTDIFSYVEGWASRDGVNGVPPNMSTVCKGKQLVTRYSWNDVVVHYNYSNLYHDWPTSYTNPDSTSAFTCVEAEATSIILAWFQKWTL